MGLEEVKQEIIDKANEKAESIISEGKKEAERIVQEANSHIREYRQKSKEEGEKTAANMEKLGIAAANNEAKRLELEMKKRLILTAFEEAKEKIVKAADSKRQDYLRKLIEKAMKEIDVETIYCSKKDSKNIKGLSFKESDIEGGIIAENKDGTVRIDYSFGTLLDSIKEKELHKIAGIIFK